MVLYWKNVKAFYNDRIFTDIETIRNIHVPGILRDFIRESNNAEPSLKRYKIGLSEKVFNSVLPFNDNIDGKSPLSNALNDVTENNLIPFATDPSGNYFCYDVITHKIVFWDNSTSTSISTGVDILLFMSSLY